MPLSQQVGHCGGCARYVQRKVAFDHPHDIVWSFWSAEGLENTQADMPPGQKAGRECNAL
jgi:hypothetical protein